MKVLRLILVIMCLVALTVSGCGGGSGGGGNDDGNDTIADNEAPDLGPGSAAVYPFTDPGNTGNWVLISNLSDEFQDSAINTNKWDTLFPGWAGRDPSRFVSANTYLSKGRLKIVMKQDYTTGVLYNKNTFQYGYAEIKAKCGNSYASSAFWLTNCTADWWTEIDIFEIWGKTNWDFIDVHHFGPTENTISTTLHEFYNPDNVKTPFVDDRDTHITYTDVWQDNPAWRPADAYHVYGLEWDAANIRFYVDGKQIRESENPTISGNTKNPKWSQELHLVLDSETFPDWAGLPLAADLPAVFSIEYVRVWHKGI